jgi:hypothetical protein
MPLAGGMVVVLRMDVRWHGQPFARGKGVGLLQYNIACCPGPVACIVRRFGRHSGRATPDLIRGSESRNPVNTEFDCVSSPCARTIGQ